VAELQEAWHNVLIPVSQEEGQATKEFGFLDPKILESPDPSLNSTVAQDYGLLGCDCVARLVFPGVSKERAKFHEVPEQSFSGVGCSSWTT
jgi:hypothetical protein